jgi:selenium metabolism protein YedF
MSETIDARGKACPQPVLMTKQGLESLAEGVLTVIVDNPMSRDNVERFAKSQGCDVEIEQRKEAYFLTIVKGHPTEVSARGPAGQKAEPSSEPNVVVYVSADHMGAGEQELGNILIRAFLKTLKDVSPLVPSRKNSYSSIQESNSPRRDRMPLNRSGNWKP